MFFAGLVFAAELAGTLTGADGEGIAGATVLAYDSRFQYGYATTRNGGEWSIVGLPTDQYRLRFLPPNADPHGDRFYGGEWDACASEAVALGEEEVRSGVDQALTVGATVFGRVVDLAGVPVPDLRVTAYGAEPRVSLIARDATTDADGSFVITGLDAELSGSAFYVFVQGEGWPEQYLGQTYSEFDSERGSFAAGSETDVGELALLDGIRVSGVISGPDGPVPSGSVFVYATQQVLAATIGEDGSYSADGLPPGDVVAWAQAPGLATTYYPDADRPGGVLSVPNEGDDATIDLSLPAESTLTLNFTGEGDLSEASVLVYNDTYSVGRGDGLTDDGSVTIFGMYPGDFYLYVYGEDGGFTSGFILDEEGERRVFSVSGATSYTLPLQLGARLTGTITGDSGEPVYGASVSVTETTGEERRWTATTDRDGRYEVLGVDKTTVTIAVSYYWYCPTDRGWAPMWYDASRSAAAAGVLLVDNGDDFADLDIELPADNDHDAMGDAWERENGLDTSRDDASEDPDLDGYTNAEEWQLGSDPTDEAVAGECGGEGCGDGAGLLGVGAGLGAALAVRRRGAGPHTRRNHAA